MTESHLHPLTAPAGDTSTSSSILSASPSTLSWTSGRWRCRQRSWWQTVGTRGAARTPPMRVGSQSEWHRWSALPQLAHPQRWSSRRTRSERWWGSRWWLLWSPVYNWVLLIHFIKLYSMHICFMVLYTNNQYNNTEPPKIAIYIIDKWQLTQ